MGKIEELARAVAVALNEDDGQYAWDHPRADREWYMNLGMVAAKTALPLIAEELAGIARATAVPNTGEGDARVRQATREAIATAILTHAKEMAK